MRIHVEKVPDTVRVAGLSAHRRVTDLNARIWTPSGAVSLEIQEWLAPVQRGRRPGVDRRAARTDLILDVRRSVEPGQ